MTEQAGTSVARLEPQVSRNIEAYRRAGDDLSQEAALNQDIVKRNPLGIVERPSFNTVMELIKQEVDLNRPIYMPDVVSQLSGENLVGMANSAFYTEGPKTATLSQIADRIRSLGSRSSQEVGAGLKGVGAEVPKEMDYIFQEMAERLTDTQVDDEARRGLVGGLDANMTPELMEYILRHQPDLLNAMVRNMHEFVNPALRQILIKRNDEMTKMQDELPSL